MIRGFDQFFGFGAQGWLQDWMPVFGPFFFVILAWSLVWKALALWKAARRGEAVWFVALLLVNTVGILEILYIYVFSKKAKAVE